MPRWAPVLTSEHVGLALTALFSKILQSFVACRYIAAKESFKAGRGGAQNLGWSGHKSYLGHWEDHPLAYANTVGCLCCAPDVEDESQVGRPLERTYSEDHSGRWRWPWRKERVVHRSMPSLANPMTTRSPRARQPQKW